jgi:membrane protein required for colicin V production
MQIALIDIIFGILILIFVARCALRGFVEELMSMASVVLGLAAAVCFFKNGAVTIRDLYMDDVQIVPEVLSFILIFFIVFLMIKTLEHMLTDIITRINLGGLDRFLGIFFGLLEGLVLVSVALVLLSIQPLFDPAPLFEQSMFAQFLLPLIGTVQTFFFMNQSINALIGTP